MNESPQLPAEPEVSSPSTEQVTPTIAPPTFDPRSGRRVIWAVSLLAAGMIVLFFIGRSARSHANKTISSNTAREVEQAPTVEVAPVVRSESVKTVILPGEARPFYETTLYARTSGYLRAWLVDIGDAVDEGQLLATIETPELDDQVTQSRAKLEALKSEVTLAQAAADFARISRDRWDTSEGVVSQQERDQKKSEFDSALARLEVSKARVSLGEAELQGLQTLQGFKRVVAPFKGIITERHVDIGHLVTAGSASSTTPLFKIVQYDQLRVFVDVPQGLSGEIALGMPVSALVPEHPERAYEGTVNRTSGAIDPKARTLRVEVLIPDADHALLPGAYLQVQFRVARLHPPLRIPAAALAMNASGPQAAVVARDGTVAFQSVRIEQDFGEYVEISDGLSDGDIVALNIGNNVANGDHVVPVRSDEASPSAATALNTAVAHKVPAPSH